MNGPTASPRLSACGRPCRSMVLDESGRLDDSAAMAAVESLTDEAEIRARDVTDPWVIDWIAEAAKDAVNGQMQRVPLLCCGLPLTHYRRGGR